MAAETSKPETEIPAWLKGMDTDSAGAPPADEAAITDAIQAAPVVPGKLVTDSSDAGSDIAASNNTAPVIPETPVLDNSDVGSDIAAQLKTRFGNDALNRLKRLGTEENPPANSPGGISS